MRCACEMKGKCKMKQLFKVFLLGLVLAVTSACYLEEETGDVGEEFVEPPAELKSCTNEEWIGGYIGCREHGSSSEDCFYMMNAACS